MTNALDSLQTGNVKEALAQLQDHVRNDPANSQYRVFLFQLLSVTGAWDRALTQLNVCADMDPATLAMVQTYQEALNCEALRAQIFAGQRMPLVFGDPEEWIALAIQALELSAQGKHDEAADVRGRAFEQAPTTAGSITTGDGDGATVTPFDWIADADMRLGPVLEAVINGKYYWVPFHRIRQVDIEKPEDLRDMVWTAAHFVWSNGGETVGLIPTRYPGSEQSEDGLVQLARKTEWQQVNEEVYHGMGQRMLATPDAEYSLLDVRKIELQSADDSAAADAAGTGEAEA